MANRNRNGFNKPIISRDRDRITLLDRALEGATAEQKARVRNVLSRLDVEDDDEFYIVITAIGYLIVLVQDAPESWRALFDDFEAKLDAWAAQNLRTLQAINQQSDNTERMTRCFQALATSTTSLSSETRTSLTRLDRLNDSLSGLTGKLDLTESHSRSLLQRLKKADDRIERLENLVIWTSGASLAALLVLLLGGGLAYRHIAHQIEFTQVLQGLTREKTSWLLEKANREECANGIKPRSDPQCQQYQ